MGCDATLRLCAPPESESDLHRVKWDKRAPWLIDAFHRCGRCVTIWQIPLAYSDTHTNAQIQTQTPSLFYGNAVSRAATQLLHTAMTPGHLHQRDPVESLPISLTLGCADESMNGPKELQWPFDSNNLKNENTRAIITFGVTSKSKTK